MSDGSIFKEAQAEFVAERDERVLAEYARHSLVDEDGAKDLDAVTAKLVTVLVDREVTSKVDRPGNALGYGEASAIVFPGAPGAEPATEDDLSPMDIAVQAALRSDVKRVLSPTPTGRAQKGLEESGLILVAGVFKNPENEDVPQVFATSNVDMILHYGTQPVAAKAVAKSAAYDAQTALVVGRIPGSREGILKQQAVTKKSVTQSLNATTTLAIEAADAEAA